MRKIFLILVLGLIYVAISELAASNKADSFCNSINIGDSLPDLHERAVAAGARASASNWQQTGANSRRFFATFTGYYPGSDFICLISEQNGRVTEKKAHLIKSLLFP